jgi:hypothetical protein
MIFLLIPTCGAAIPTPHLWTEEILSFF